MTRSSLASNLYFIEDITLHERRLRKEKRKQVSSSHLESHIHIFEHPHLEQPLEPNIENLIHNRIGEETPKKILKELYEPNAHQKLVFIVVPTTNFHLRLDLISLRGSNGEDLHKHLKDFSYLSHTG